MELSRSYFELFELPQQFAVDVAELAVRYRLLQQSVHPDRHVSASVQDRRLAMQYATYVNQAYAALKDPLPRAVYMVGLTGRVVRENPILPPDFLMEQIELREELESIETMDNAASGEAALASLLSRLKREIADLEADFGREIERDLDAAEATLYQMQFLYRLQASAAGVEERLLGY